MSPRQMIQAALLVLALGCSSSNPGQTRDAGSGGSPGGSGGSGVVTGVVTDIGTGAPISGAAVSGGGQSANTDARGAFSLSGLANGAVVLSVRMSGYAPGYANGNVGASSDSVLVRLKAEGTPQAYSTATTQTLSVKTENGPYAVILPANSVDTTDPNITVSVTPLDPTTEAAALPGSLVAGDSSVLLPVTFAEFTLRDSAGNRLNLKPSASATVELPIPASLRSTYPEGTKIHCYSYDSTTGKWADFVDGTVQASSVDNTSPVLAASIRHFSWYGGAPQGNTCVDAYVKVISAVDGKPLENARVEATPGTVGYTDTDGYAMVRTAISPNPSTFTAYQTGIDVDGSLTGIPGAKYIEFGTVDDELPGLVQKPCNGGSILGANAVVGSQASQVLGTQGSPITIAVGLTKGVYEALAILSTAGGTGSLTVQLEQGVPGPSGQLQNPVPADGAKLYVSTPGSAPVALMATGAGGFYVAPSSFPIVSGTTYTLTIDADGNGSIDGSGTVSALGDLAFTNPTDGADLAASGFVARWTDTGSADGGVGYAPLYQALITSTGNPLDSAYYLGTDRQFTVVNALDGGTLTPGSYTANLIGFAGAYTGAQAGLSISKNITGMNVTGHFYSFSGAQPVNFTVH